MKTKAEKQSAGVPRVTDINIGQAGKPV